MDAPCIVATLQAISSRWYALESFWVACSRILNFLSLLSFALAGPSWPNPSIAAGMLRDAAGARQDGGGDAACGSYGEVRGIVDETAYFHQVEEHGRVDWSRARVVVVELARLSRISGGNWSQGPWKDEIYRQCLLGSVSASREGLLLGGICRWWRAGGRDDVGCPCGLVAKARTNIFYLQLRARHNSLQEEERRR